MQIEWLGWCSQFGYCQIWPKNGIAKIWHWDWWKGGEGFVILNVNIWFWHGIWHVDGLGLSGELGKWCWIVQNNRNLMKFIKLVRIIMLSKWNLSRYSCQISIEIYCVLHVIPYVMQIETPYGLIWRFKIIHLIDLDITIISM